MGISKKAIEVLKSGKFLIYYHDNGSCTLYSGKKEDESKVVSEFDGSQEGYIPEEVSFLVKALGGKVESI